MPLFFTTTETAARFHLAPPVGDIAAVPEYAAFLQPDVSAEPLIINVIGEITHRTFVVDVRFLHPIIAQVGIVADIVQIVEAVQVLRQVDKSGDVVGMVAKLCCRLELPHLPIRHIQLGG